MYIPKLLIVLGSPNTPNGQLGQIALDRVNYCFHLFEQEPKPILCTGGFGNHFNLSPWPHAELLKNKLLQLGVNDDYFLPLALSANTVEDATKSLAILQNYAVATLQIITSNYHLERVKLIFDIILSSWDREYFGVEHVADLPELASLMAHEQKAIAQIKNNGLYY
ncbi:YdcF family protein [Aquirufa rosea]|uniref:YdcF family protein n=1 Tax=Aquirufa rosea TaxID=2509241 RepID=A0A4V1M5P7_9BACT|nr:YdcF family protein [Aquirufa rosea]RXK52152.1 YdcF family protein [Aquirufa rosea]